MVKGCSYVGDLVIIINCALQDTEKLSGLLKKLNRKIRFFSFRSIFYKKIVVKGCSYVGQDEKL